MQHNRDDSYNIKVLTLLERVLFLKEVYVFKNVSAERLSVIAEIIKEVVVEPGETIAQEGDMLESLYIIKEGVLRIIKEKDGKQYTLKNISKGECFGIFSVFSDKRGAAGAVANEKSKLLEIRRVDFKKVLISNPEISYNLLEILSDRVAELDNEIVFVNKTLQAQFINN